MGDTRNILLQKWPAPEFSCVTKLDISDIKDGDTAGYISLGMNYSAFIIEKCDGKLAAYQVKGFQDFDCDGAYTEEQKEEVQIEGLEDNTENVYIRYTVKRTGTQDHYELGLPVLGAPVEETTIEVSLDGKYTNPLTIPAKAGRWVGMKNGMFIRHNNRVKSEPGSMTVESVIYHGADE